MPRKKVACTVCGGSLKLVADTWIGLDLYSDEDDPEQSDSESESYFECIDCGSQFDDVPEDDTTNYVEEDEYEDIT